MPIRPLAEDFFNRASAKLSEAKRQLQQEFHYDVSVSASQECIELSVKSIFSMLKDDFEPQHKIGANQFVEIWGLIPPEMSTFVYIPRLWLLNKFWGDLYQIAKYGNDTGELGSDKFKVGASRILKSCEAEFALKHAEEVHLAASHLRSWSFSHSSGYL